MRCRQHEDECALPFSLPNVRLFIAFRIFFNARFYYPVFTILFLDYGLTLERFAILNAVWAATIVLVEVPSGALADTLGRRRLLLFSGVSMVLEMVLMAFAPRGPSGWLFPFFLVNRVLSGTAEASASGADEALAYDSLKAAGLAREWGRVLERQIRWQAGAFMAASLVGAAVYDPGLMQRVAAVAGFDQPMEQAVTMRFPVYLTLAMAVGALTAAWRMSEPDCAGSKAVDGMRGCGRPVADAVRLTFRAGVWIVKTPFALVVILGGLLFDHVIRMILTLNSQYYRLIGLPEAAFGLIGAAMAAVGLFAPRAAARLALRCSPRCIFALLAGATILGLAGMPLFVPVYGMAPMLLLIAVMYVFNFFLSHYLNRITASEQRATVLSFKGLSFNLAYGMLGLVYSAGLAAARRLGTGEDALFPRSIGWFPWYFLAAVAVFLLVSRRRLRGIDIHKLPG